LTPLKVSITFPSFPEDLIDGFLFLFFMLDLLDSNIELKSEKSGKIVGTSKTIENRATNIIVVVRPAIISDVFTFIVFKSKRESMELL
jgi:hypothetical protein